MIKYDRTKKKLFIPSGLGNISADGGGNYDKGYADGAAHQKAVDDGNLTHIDIDHNGHFQAEYGYSDVDVNVDTIGPYNRGYDEGFSSGYTNGFDNGYDEGLSHCSSGTCDLVAGWYDLIDGEFTGEARDLTVQDLYPSSTAVGFSTITIADKDYGEAKMRRGFNSGYTSGYTDGYAAGRASGITPSSGMSNNICEVKIRDIDPNLPAGHTCPIYNFSVNGFENTLGLRELSDYLVIFRNSLIPFDTIETMVITGSRGYGSSSLSRWDGFDLSAVTINGFNIAWESKTVELVNDRSIYYPVITLTGISNYKTAYYAEGYRDGQAANE